MEWLPAEHWWRWGILAVVLFTLEVFSPGAFFLWMAIAAAITALAAFVLVPLDWQWQVLIFALFSVVSVVLGRVFLVRHPIESDQPRLNRRGEQYVGRTFTLDQPIVNNQGKIRVDDSTWKIRGADCPAGTRVDVTGVDGVVLLVQQHQA